MLFVPIGKPTYKFSSTVSINEQFRRKAVRWWVELTTDVTRDFRCASV